MTRVITVPLGQTHHMQGDWCTQERKKQTVQDIRGGLRRCMGF